MEVGSTFEYLGMPPLEVATIICASAGSIAEEASVEEASAVSTDEWSPTFVDGAAEVESLVQAATSKNEPSEAATKTKRMPVR
ncbi:hypothetical protein AKJ09_00838 [Labilithrix luteola]|uniref:Uncharacterized protein n=1 Tax=Labilithrix luteola TaxID=1391654 RepID=A0A0K1PM41_9BACT|nr:hypothetical protein AKJ09_00838 [Labilithrix luteola]